MITINDLQIDAGLNWSDEVMTASKINTLIKCQNEALETAEVIEAKVKIGGYIKTLNDIKYKIKVSGRKLTLSQWLS